MIDEDRFPLEAEWIGESDLEGLVVKFYSEYETKIIQEPHNKKKADFHYLGKASNDTISCFDHYHWKILDKPLNKFQNSSIFDVINETLKDT